MKIGEAFEFEPPVGWRESREGAQHIFRGPNDEALIVSGYFMSGRQTTDKGEVLKRLFASACNVISKAANNSEWREVTPLAEEANSKNWRFGHNTT